MLAIEDQGITWFILCEIVTFTFGSAFLSLPKAVRQISQWRFDQPIEPVGANHLGTLLDESK